MYYMHYLLFLIFQLTKTFSPEKTPETWPGSMTAGMRLFITQVHLSLLSYLSYLNLSVALHIFTLYMHE